MKLLKNKNALDLEKIIKPVDDDIINGLINLALSCNKDTEAASLRDNFLYKSNYKADNLEEKELDLERYLMQQNSDKVKTEYQNKEYNWIKINKENMSNITQRFYIAPKPDNMHEIVKMLTDTFLKLNVPVRMKYQLTTRMEQCDRIIIYTDYENRKAVETAIKQVYLKNPRLFSGAERSLAWLYTTDIPGVYTAPETPNIAYSSKLAESILAAKYSFNYLYGLKENQKLSFEGEEAKKAMSYMEMLIISTFLRNGLLFSKEGKQIVFNPDKNMKTYYDFKTGILENSNLDERGYYEVSFLPSYDGRKALLDNYYSVSKIKSQNGVKTRYLTKEEKEKEKDKALFEDYYKWKTKNK